jgi:hypothetical protein
VACPARVLHSPILSGLPTAAALSPPRSRVLQPLGGAAGPAAPLRQFSPSRPQLAASKRAPLLDRSVGPTDLGATRVRRRLISFTVLRSPRRPEGRRTAAPLAGSHGCGGASQGRGVDGLSCWAIPGAQRQENIAEKVEQDSQIREEEEGNRRRDRFFRNLLDAEEKPTQSRTTLASRADPAPQATSSALGPPAACHIVRWLKVLPNT